MSAATGTDSQQVAAYAALAALKGVGPPSYADPGGLRLGSTDIGAMRGFETGRPPTPVGDMVADWFGEWRDLTRDEWHDVLWDMVHDHLLPAMGTPDLHLRRHRTINNPVRLSPRVQDRVLPDAEVRVAWLEVLARVLIRLPENAPEQVHPR